MFTIELHVQLKEPPRGDALIQNHYGQLLSFSNIQLPGAPHAVLLNRKAISEIALLHLTKIAHPHTVPQNDYLDQVLCSAFQPQASVTGFHHNKHEEEVQPFRGLWVHAFPQLTSE